MRIFKAETKGLMEDENPKGVDAPGTSATAAVESAGAGLPTVASPVATPPVAGPTEDEKSETRGG